MSSYSRNPAVLFNPTATHSPSPVLERPAGHRDFLILSLISASSACQSF